MKKSTKQLILVYISILIIMVGIYKGVIYYNNNFRSSQSLEKLAKEYDEFALNFQKEAANARVIAQERMKEGK